MPRTLLDWLVERFPEAKKQTLKRMAAGGRVTVNGVPARRLSQALTGEDQVVVDDAGTAPRRSAPTRPKPTHPGGWQIVFEDADVLVVDKPSGLLTSTVPREPRPTLIALVRAYAAERDRRARVGLIHRLDRHASGLLVFSKSDDAFRSLKDQLFRREVERVYRAVVRGDPQPPAGRIESKLVERTDGSVHSTKQWDKGEVAVTDYEVIAREGPLATLKVTLHTGRKHQIRVHLRERGWPVVGDRVYGTEEDKLEPRLMLAAVRLAFDHPRTGERVTFEIPLSREFPMRDVTPARQAVEGEGSLFPKTPQA